MQRIDYWVQENQHQFDVVTVNYKELELVAQTTY